MGAWKGIVGQGFTARDFASYCGSLRMGTWHPEFVVLHNTGAPRLDQWHSHPGAERMRNLESYYRDEQKWSAGPHLFVADDLIWVFTPLTVPGVHAPSWNRVSWGVEMVGDYDSEPFMAGAGAHVRDNAVSALASLHMLGQIDSHTLRFHREDPKTTHRDCPGGHVDKPDMIRRVHEEIVRRLGNS